MSKIRGECSLVMTVRVKCMVRIGKSIPFTDPIVTNVCDIGLSKEGYLQRYARLLGSLSQLSLNIHQ